jgi:uracil-DNA glycosylase
MADSALRVLNETSSGSASARLITWNPQDWPVAAGWEPVITRFLVSDSGQQLTQFLRNRLAGEAVIYPPTPFRALQLTPVGQVKVVILGQDPYHGPAQADGLAFSVPMGVKTPPSLRNIFKEIAAEYAEANVASRMNNGQGGLQEGGSLLERWARQGVLLLNTCLTVEEGRPGSHAKQGWEALTDEIIQIIWQSDQPVVFMLWGAQAQTKMRLLRCPTGSTTCVAAASKHLVLTANHPSPLSALRPPQPFLGCGHFEAANVHLVRHGAQPVQWLASA